MHSLFINGVTLIVLLFIAGMGWTGYYQEYKQNMNYKKRLGEIK